VASLKEFSVRIGEVHGFVMAGRVKGFLEGLEGVVTTNLTLDLGSSSLLVKVRYDEDVIKQSKIKEALVKSGFKILGSDKKVDSLKPNTTGICTSC